MIFTPRAVRHLIDLRLRIVDNERYHRLVALSLKVPVLIATVMCMDANAIYASHFSMMVVTRDLSKDQQ